MKKAFKWVLFSTLILALGAVIAVFSIYLPNYNNYANYSTEEGYNLFISYDQDSIEVVKNEEGEPSPYTFKVRLYNLSNKEQTLVFRFWFTCRKGAIQTYEYVDKEITIPAAKNSRLNAPFSYYTGSIDYSCELYQFADYTNVEFGAKVKCAYIAGYSNSDPESKIDIYGVLVNLDGYKNFNGFQFTTDADMCEYLKDNTNLMYSLNKNWQEAFDGVILALSVFGGIIVLCLVFTVVLLLPNKKKKVANEVVNQVNINEANLKQENNNGVNNNQENANNVNNN